jgi:UDP-N-acetylglucosamine 2-epimerase (non-hydrolysing)
VVTGNTSIDALLTLEKRQDDELDGAMASLNGRRVVLVTAHRRENHGARLEGICEGLRRVGEKYGDSLRIVYPVHPNPAVHGTVRAALGRIPNILLTGPIDYAPFVSTLKRADLVLTDSGGLQEECPSLGKPVLVLRDKTERPEVVAAGAARLVGCSPDRIVEESSRLLDDGDAYRKMAVRRHLFGDGRAAPRIVEALLAFQRSLRHGVSSAAVSLSARLALGTDRTGEYGDGDGTTRFLDGLLVSVVSSLEAVS